MIEKPFGVQVSRTQREGKSRYGQAITWFDYRLNKTNYNSAGIKKMMDYIAKQSPENPKTNQEHKTQKIINQLQLL